MSSLTLNPSTHHPAGRPLVAITWLTFLVASTSPVGAQSGMLTAQIGDSAPQRIQLIDHRNDWHYRKGTSEPPVDWPVRPDASLDASWLTGGGGIGYGDGDDTTVLADMRGNYLSVYVRQSFEIGSTSDPGWRLQLVIDWDDGFIAYLDGVEVGRSGNVPGTPGNPHPYNQDLGNQSHEASAGAGGNPPLTLDLGPVGDRLSVGTHVLAIQIINDDLNSSDLSLMADLFLADSEGGGSLIEGLYALVTQEPITLTGTNTWPESTRVVVNGLDGNLNLAQGTWAKSQSLTPGMNRLHIAALDSSGQVLASTNLDVVYQATSEVVGGILDTDTTWSAANGVVRVTEDLRIVQGATLSIQEGAVVLLAPDASILVWTNSALDVVGTEDHPVFFLPADGVTPWGEISALGGGATVQLRFAELAAGQVRILQDGVITVEDSVLRDLYARQMVEAFNGTQLTFRRTHFNRYAQTHFDDTPVLIEDCLIENVSSDATDFQSGPEAIVVRRTTYRFGVGGNTDAVDMDFSLGVRVEDCLIHDFPDKAISIADLSHGAIIHNNLIYNAAMGISCYASSNCVFTQNTVVTSGYGLRLYLRADHPGPGFGTGANNIFWDNNESVSVTDGSELVLTTSDVSGVGVFPGTGNINADPLFVNPEARDYRLSTGSPAIGAGTGGADLGVLSPVGGMPSAPFHLGLTPLSSSEIRLAWLEDADNEVGFAVERSTDGVNWQVVAEVEPNVTSHTDTGLVSAQPYWYRVRATHAFAPSRPSAVARAVTLDLPVVETVVGGTLSGPTLWTTNMGTILVLSDVTVPVDTTLTVGPGSHIKMADGVALVTTGGTIHVLGTAEQKVVVEPLQRGGTWRELSASAGGSLTLRHADVSGGPVQVLSDAYGLLEDCHIHHYSPSGSAIIHSVRAALVTVRRCHVEFYHETLFQLSLVLIEDCLFESAINDSSDAVDFDSASPGSVIRRCTFRTGLQTNTDAIDIGPTGGINTQGVLIEDCLIHDFTDKGISVGDGRVNQGATLGLTIRNCLIYNTARGIQVKGESWVTVHDCTIADSAIGLHGYEKTADTGGGIFTNTFNNLLSRNVEAIVTEPDTFIRVSYSDTHGADWPGDANLNLDPMFLDAPGHDYRLADDSPCRAAGFNGEDLGVAFPVGGLPAAPRSLQVVSQDADQLVLGWEDTSSNESGFVIDRSLDGLTWTVVETAPADATTHVLTLEPGAESSPLFRVRATNFIGASFSSNNLQPNADPEDLDGDGMPDAWESLHGLDPSDGADAHEDPDLDGASNLAEFRAGTDPTDALSVLQFLSVSQVDATTLRFSFEAQPNRTYTLEANELPDAGGWQSVWTIPAETSARILTIDLPRSLLTPTQYFRLVTP